MKAFSSNDRFGKARRWETNEPKEIVYLVSEVTSELPHPPHQINSGEQASISFEQTNDNKVTDNGQEGSTGYQATSKEPIVPSRNYNEGKNVAL